MVQSPPLWSPLPVAEWGATYDTLHMYAQIVGWPVDSLDLHE